jgi:single-strand DNA-binding protein
MARLNRVLLLGNVTRPVSLRYTSSGVPVAEVGLAVNDRRKRGGEWVEAPTFVDCVLWQRQAEVASEYLVKGSLVLVEGRLQLDRWVEPESGENRSRLRVVAHRMQMLKGSAGDSVRSAEDTPSYEESHNVLDDGDLAQEIPF